MRKLAVIFFVLWVFAGCIRQQEINPPELNVEPDSIQIVSPIDLAVFTIKGFSEEDLKRFTITTEPWIYAFDTVFPSFSHVLDKYVEMKAPEGLNVGSDSLIAVKFVLQDSQNKTEIIRYLKYIEGYPPLERKLVSLYYRVPDSNFFYSASLLKAYNCADRLDSYIDFVFYFDTDNGFCLISPDSRFLANKLTEQGCYYNTDNKNHTEINFVNIAVSDIEPKTVYNLDLSGNYINDNADNGVGLTNLKEGDVIGFIGHDRRKGIVEIIDTDFDAKRLTFRIYVQKYPAK